MNGNNSKFTIVSLYLISAILAFTMIIEAVYITPALAQTTGRYTEISRTINIPKNIPNSSSSSSDNPSLPNGISNGIPISPVVNRYQQGSLMFI
jgi:hypothetical protein